MSADRFISFVLCSSLVTKFDGLNWTESLSWHTTCRCARSVLCWTYSSNKPTAYIQHYFSFWRSPMVPLCEDKLWEKWPVLIEGIMVFTVYSESQLFTHIYSFTAVEWDSEAMLIFVWWAVLITYNMFLPSGGRKNLRHVYAAYSYAFDMSVVENDY